MTRDEIMAMQSGRELDALVEREIIFRDSKDDPAAQIYFDAAPMWCKPYSTDISAAWEVVEKMKSEGFEPCITFDEAKWSVDLRIWNAGDGTDHNYVEGCESASEAICKAALLAVMEVSE